MTRIYKVLAWRACSITITLVVTWIWTGDVRSATTLTMFLHLFLVISHYLFENVWDKLEKKGSDL